jgi:hypothetical protein
MSPSAEGFTDQDSLNSALRLDLRPGEWVLWSGRPHRFESLRGTCARIRDSNSTELREVDVAEIRGMPTLALENLDERLDGLRTSGDPTWQTAMQREEIIRQVMVEPGPAKPRIRSAAESLKVSTRTIQRLIARYKSSAQTTSLVPHQSGPRNYGDGWALFANGSSMSPLKSVISFGPNRPWKKRIEKSFGVVDDCIFRRLRGTASSNGFAHWMPDWWRAGGWGRRPPKGLRSQHREL